MALLASYPAYTDDSGNGQSGTLLNQSWLDSQKASIEDQVHSTTNTTVKPKAITDEVVTARGSKASLDARLDVALNEDGTLKTQSALVSTTTAQTLPQGNLIPNADMLLWSQGDAAAPDFFVLSGAGAAVARTGVGQGDTQVMGYGDFAAKLTYGSAAAKLTHTLLAAAAFARATGLKGRKVVIACKAKSSIANHASLVVDDGVTQTRGGLTGNGTYHSGGGAVEWLYAVHTISASATKLEVYVETASAGAAYFGDVVAMFSDLAPTDFHPCPMVEGTYHFTQSGTLSTGTQKATFLPHQPGIIVYVQLYVKTAPVGAAIIVDINSWDGAAFTTAFTTKPTIADGASVGGAAPDGTYARRCLKPIWGATAAAGYAVTVDTDQVGSGTAGADLSIEVRVRQYVRALAPFLDHNQL